MLFYQKNKLISLFALLLTAVFPIAGMDEPVKKTHILWGASALEGTKHAMEDTLSSQVSFRNRSVEAFFGIFDGHAGSIVPAQLAANELHKDFEKFLNSGLSVTKSLELAFESIDKKITKAGTAALVAYMQGAQVFFAWAGDSRAIVGRNGKVIYETIDHKPDNPQEVIRLKQFGAEIGHHPMLGPVADGFPMTRMLGDHFVKQLHPGALIAVPTVSTVTIQPNDLIIIASDGIWDVVTNQEALNLVQKIIETEQAKSAYPLSQYEAGNNQTFILAARALKDLAKQRGTTDDISVQVISLDAGAQKIEAAQEQIKSISQTQPVLAEKEELISKLQKLKDDLYEGQQEYKARFQKAIDLLQAQPITNDLLANIEQLIQLPSNAAITSGQHIRSAGNRIELIRGYIRQIKLPTMEKEELISKLLRLKNDLLETDLQNREKIQSAIDFLQAQPLTKDVLDIVDELIQLPKNTTLAHPTHIITAGGRIKAIRDYIKQIKSKK